MFKIELFFQEAWDPQEVQWINSASLELNLQTSDGLELNLPTSNPPDSLTSTESPLNLDSPSSPASHIEVGKTQKIILAWRKFPLISTLLKIQ